VLGQLGAALDGGGDAEHRAGVGAHRQARPPEEREGVALPVWRPAHAAGVGAGGVLGVESVHLADLVGPERQGPRGGDDRVLLAQRPGGCVARFTKSRSPASSCRLFICSKADVGR